MSERTDLSRRGWLRAVGRLSLAAVLGGGVTALALRDGGSCAEPRLCRECAALERCDLPDAERVRQATRDEQRHTDAG